MQIKNFDLLKEKLKADMGFIRIIFGICLAIGIIITVVLTGVSTYLTLMRRKSEIAVFYIYGVPRWKIMLKLFFETFVLASTGLLVEIILTFVVWKSIESELYLNKSKGMMVGDLNRIFTTATVVDTLHTVAVSDIVTDLCHKIA